MPSYTPDTLLICANARCDFTCEPWAVSEDVCPQCGADLDEVASRPPRAPRTPRPQRRPVDERERPPRAAQGRRRPRERRDF
jgi:hypothetical protein